MRAEFHWKKLSVRVYFPVVEEHFLSRQLLWSESKYERIQMKFMTCLELRTIVLELYTDTSKNHEHESSDFVEIEVNCEGDQTTNSVFPLLFTSAVEKCLSWLVGISRVETANHMIARTKMCWKDSVWQTKYLPQYLYRLENLLVKGFTSSFAS